MARLTYRDRLSTLIANTSVSARDREFASSLLTYYDRKGRLSAGRAKWIATLEDRYSIANVASAVKKHAGMLDRLNTLYILTEPESYANGFIESLISQTRADRRLSDRQLETLVKIESEHDEDALAARENWMKNYLDNPTLRSEALIVAHYYRTTGYFGTTADNVIMSDTFIPTYSQYNKMVKNKYAQKVLAAHYSIPKYDAGQLVSFRANTPLEARRCGDFQHLKTTVTLMVISANAAPITNAARGSKVYKLLPIGKAETLHVEERYIMKARKLGTTKK